MIYRNILLALLLLSIVVLTSACTTAAKPKNYYPVVNDPPWVFSGNLHGTNGEISITINNEVVLQGVIASFSESITLKGSYRDKEIKSKCSYQYCSGGIQCSVFVDSKAAVLLDFSGL